MFFSFSESILFIKAKLSRCLSEHWWASIQPKAIYMISLCNCTQCWAFSLWTFLSVTVEILNPFFVCVWILFRYGSFPKYNLHVIVSRLLHIFCVYHIKSIEVKYWNRLKLHMYLCAGIITQSKSNICHKTKCNDWVNSDIYYT